MHFPRLPATPLAALFSHASCQCCDPVMIAAFAAAAADCGAKVCPKTGPHEGESKLETRAVRFVNVIVL